MYFDLLEGKKPDEDTLRHLLQTIQSYNNLIIYGAGRSGTMLARLLAACGIHLSGFVDRNWETLREIDNVVVRSPQSLADVRDTDHLLVIIGAGQSHLVELIEKDLDQINPRISTVSGVSLVYLLHYRKCKHTIECGGQAPSLNHCISYHVKPYKCPIFCRHVEALNPKAAEPSPSSLATLNDFGYMVSESCTLKCEHCHEAVPYLKSNTRLPRETIIEDIRLLTQACSFVHRLDIVGGEPLAHPDILEIIRDLLAIPGIGYIGVFTNGTVVPDSALCEALCSNRVIVTVSDYSHHNNLSTSQTARIRKTIETLEAHKVTFVVIPDRYWFDMNGFNTGDLPEQRLRENFSHCFMAACHRVYDGVLYHCPYQAAGTKLGRLQKRDCVNIREHSPSQLVEELNKFDQATFIDACRYCNLPRGPREVIAGKQLPSAGIEGWE